MQGVLDHVFCDVGKFAERCPLIRRKLPQPPQRRDELALAPQESYAKFLKSCGVCRGRNVIQRIGAQPVEICHWSNLKKRGPPVGGPLGSISWLNKKEKSRSDKTQRNFLADSTN